MAVVHVSQLMFMVIAAVSSWFMAKFMVHVVVLVHGCSSLCMGFVHDSDCCLVIDRSILTDSM